MDPLEGGDPRGAGRYRFQARLGSGGMGRVYLAFSPGGRAVAVKVVHPELARDPAFLARFRQEVAAARQVSGAYTAPVVDASGDGEDPPWLATVLVPGSVAGRHRERPRAIVPGIAVAASGGLGGGTGGNTKPWAGSPRPQAAQCAAGH
jgi:hypothetical protein